MSTTVTLRSIVLTLSALGWIAGSASAQAPTGAVIGTVLDQTGSRVPDAAVRVVSIDTGAERTTTSDHQGRYEVVALPTGDYEVEVSHAGFRTAVQRPIRITVGRAAGVDVRLPLGEVSERVEVIRDAPLIDRLQSGLGALVAQDRMRDLPLNGRSVEQLALTQPGVVAYPYAANDLQYGAGAKFSAFGARPQSNLFLLDGTDINDQADFTPGNAAGVVLGVDTLREFRVLTHGYSAEFGRKSGGIIQAVTKSGSNVRHGSAFYFGRNDALDARNFFDLGDKPPFERHQYGGTYGGPVLRDRTFVFTGYEELREDLGLSLVAIVPDANAHRGCVPNASSTSGVRCVGVNPAVQPYLDLLPPPNGTLYRDGTGDFHSSPNRPTRARNMTARIDQVIGRSGDSFFARYTLDDATVSVPDRIPSFSTSLRSRYQYVTAEHRKILSGAALNVLRAGFNDSRSDTLAAQTIGATPELAFVPGQQMIGNINIDSIATSSFDQGFGPQMSLPRRFDYRLYELGDDMSYSRGAHLVKVGATVKFNDLNVKENALSPRGAFNFATISDFLQGKAYLFRSEAPGSDTARRWHQVIAGAYAQDDVRVSSRLTVNAGLRFETVTVPAEQNGKASYLSSITAPDVTPGRLWATNPAGALWEPRVGAAYRVDADGRLQISTGLGLYDDLPVSYFYSIAGSRTSPYHYVGSITNPTFPSGLTGIFQPGARNLVAFDPVLRTPRELHYDLTIRRELGARTLLTVGYVGKQGRHLVRHQQANHRIPVQLPDGQNYYPPNAPLVNPAFNEIRLISTDAESSYNGVQVVVDRRLSHGLQFQVSYVLSRSMDNASGGWGTDMRNQESLVEDPYAPDKDMSLSAFDARHAFTFNATAHLPRPSAPVMSQLFGGWEASVVGRLSSGSPFTVVWAGNRGRTYPGSTRSRPDLGAGANSNPVLGGPDHYFDPTAFVPQPAGFTGNLGRNTLIGPGFAAVDAALVRTLRLGSGRLQLRFEGFNIMNRANFGIPLRVVFDNAGNRIASAGRITSTIAPSRQLQFGAKFLF